MWGGIVGYLKAKTGAHEVIVTIMFNYIAVGILAWLLTTKAFLRPGRQDPISPAVHDTSTFPSIFGQLHVGFLVALVAPDTALYFLLLQIPAGSFAHWIAERRTG